MTDRITPATSLGLGIAASARNLTTPGRSLSVLLLVIQKGSVTTQYNSNVVARLNQLSTKVARGAMLGSGYVVRLPGLWRARLLAALSQRGLAKKAGVSPSTIARIESGEESHPSTLRKLADALGVQPIDLLEPPR